MKVTGRGLVVCTGLLLLVAACDKGGGGGAGAGGPVATPEAPASAATPGSAASGQAPVEAGNYTIKTTAGELKTGADGELTVLIQPAPGFKINEEYPWKLTVTGDAVVAPKEGELGRDRWTLSKSEATLKVPVSAKGAGEGKVTGQVTFSVCNDSACDVIRDKEVAWAVTPSGG